MKNLIFAGKNLIILGLLCIGPTLFAQTIRMTVKEDLRNCTGVAPQTCMQVKYKASKDWENFYGSITGFNYEEGYRYVIDVKRTKRKNVPADASAYLYQLKKVIKKEKISNTSISIPTNNSIWNFITKHKWQLIQMKGKLVTGNIPYLVFEKEKSSFYGFSGCNRIFGSVEKTEKEISFNNIASTMMACEQNKIETEFIQILNNKKFSFDVADQTLNLYYDKKLVLMFGKTALEEK